MAFVKPTLLKSGIFIIALILLGKILALVKDVVISAYFGTGQEIDAYFMAMNTNTVLFIAFWSTITIVFLPLYSEALIRNGKKSASDYASKTLNIFSVISIVLMVLIILFAPQILDAIDLSEEVARREIAIVCLRMMTLSFLFSTVTTFLTSMQLTHNQYFFVHLVPIINNFVVILAAIFLSGTYGVYSIVIAGVLAWVIQLPLHLFAVRTYFSYIPKISLPKEDLKRLGFLIAPAFLGLLVDQLNLLVNTVLVSGLDLGSISALNYANKLVTLASGTFIVAIMTMMFPLFSKNAAENNMPALNQSISSGVRLIFLIMVPITLVTLFFHQDIVQIVFQRGAFDAEATALTSPILFYFSLGLIFLGLREVFNKAFYAMKITTIPLYISLVSVAVNIPLSIWLVGEMQANGLALATSLSLSLYAFLQVILLRRQLIGKGGVLFYDDSVICASN